MATNWRGIQAFGVRKPGFTPPKDVCIKAMSMGSWHGDLMKNGTKRSPSPGGGGKAKGRAKRKIQVLA